MQNVPFGNYGYSISVLVISIMLSVGGIIFGLGFATNSKRMKEFGRNELVQSLVNGALVGCMLLLFSSNGVVSSLITSMTLQNGTSISCAGMLSSNAAICFAYNYLVGPGPYTFMGRTNYSILTISSLLLSSLYVLYAVLGIFSIFLSPILGQIKYITQLLATVAIGATVQAAILAFVAVSALTLLLPLGIVLRTFYPTRKLGGFMIALSIGLYVVLPLSYVLDAGIIGSYAATGISGIDEVTLSVSGAKSNLLSLSSSIENATSQGLLSSAFALLSAPIAMLSNLVNMLLSKIAYLIVYAFILPAFSLIITSISIKELSQLLGSEIPSFKLNLV